MESERTDSIEALWEDFALAVKKLGFGEVVSTHREASCYWGIGLTRSAMRSERHELQITGETVFIDLSAPKQMGEKLFEIKAELLAEMWQNAARRLTERNNSTFALPVAEENENAIAGTAGLKFASV